MFIKCCRDCVAPKRYPGCHGNCQEYLDEKAEHERRKEEIDRKKKISNDIYNRRADRVAKALRSHGRK